MGLFRWLLLAFLTVPVAEIYVLIGVGGQIGAPLTVALVVGTAVTGAALMRAQGLLTLQRVQASLERGELPAVEMIEGVVLLVSGALLLTPGFITDTIGFLGLVPALRRGLALRFLAARPAASPPGSPPGGAAGPGASGHVIEGEFRVEDD